MKATDIVKKFKEVLLSADESINEVELEEVDAEVNLEEKEEELVPEKQEAREEIYATKEEVAELRTMLEDIMDRISEKDDMEKDVPSELEEIKEELKEEVKEELSAEPIVHTPEEVVVKKKMNLFSQDRQETRLERIFSKINNK